MAEMSSIRVVCTYIFIFIVLFFFFFVFFFFFSSRRRHTRWPRDWSSDVCSSDLNELPPSVDFKNIVYFNYHDLSLQYPILEKSTDGGSSFSPCANLVDPSTQRSEERRVGKECRSRSAPEQ